MKGVRSNISEVLLKIIVKILENLQEKTLGGVHVW